MGGQILSKTEARLIATDWFQSGQAFNCRDVGEWLTGRRDKAAENYAASICQSLERRGYVKRVRGGYQQIGMNPAICKPWRTTSNVAIDPISGAGISTRLGQYYNFWHEKA